MGLIDDAKDKMNDVENKFHEEKGKMEGRQEAEQNKNEEVSDAYANGERDADDHLEDSEDQV